MFWVTQTLTLRIMKKLLAVLFIFCSLSTLKSQNIGVGADIMYNFQSESFGAGGRVNFFPYSRLSIVPQFAYYFSFNKVHEYFLGAGLEYKIVQKPKVNLYVLAHGSYNAWLNYTDSEMVGAQKNNWNLDGGIGISNNWCLRPFLEYRYNVKFQETHLRLGVLYIFGCRGDGSNADGGGKGSLFGSKVYGHKRCAAYD